MGLNPKKQPYICDLQDKTEGRNISEGKGTKFRKFQKKRRQDKIKAEAKIILWTEKQVSITLLCVELKMQNEIFPSWGCNEP